MSARHGPAEPRGRREDRRETEFCMLYAFNAQWCARFGKQETRDDDMIIGPYNGMLPIRDEDIRYSCS